MGNNPFENKLDYESIKCFFASWLFFKYLICLTIGYILNRVGLRNSGVNEAIYYTVLAMGIVLLISKKPRIKSRQILTSIVYILVLGIALIYSNIVSPGAFKVDKSGISYVELLIYFLVIVLVYASIEDFDKLMHVIGIFARILSPVLFVYFALEYIRSGNSFSGYDMVEGYQASLCALVLFNNIKRKRHVYDIIMFAVMVALAFLGGSRGATLVILVFVCLNIIFHILTIRSLLKRILLIFLVLLIATIISLYFYDFISWLINVLNNLGIRSRTLESVLGSTETTESNLARLQLFNICIESWENMPLLGYGILGDRLLINGTYPHNVFIEIITHFGFFVGIALIAVLLLASISQCIKSKKRVILLLLIAFTFTHLMLSGTYLKSEQLFILIGVLLNRSSKYIPIEK